MAPHVLAQVVAAHEALVAHGAGEAFLARMGAEMARELVGAREPLAASFPATRVGTLARVGPDMCLEVGALSVGLPASIEGTYVRPLLLLPSSLGGGGLGDKARVFRARRQLDRAGAAAAAAATAFRRSLRSGDESAFLSNRWLGSGVEQRFDVGKRSGWARKRSGVLLSVAVTRLWSWSGRNGRGRSGLVGSVPLGIDGETCACQRFLTQVGQDFGNEEQRCRVLFVQSVFGCFAVNGDCR